MNVNIGIGWSQDKRDVAFANQAGALLVQLGLIPIRWMALRTLIASASGMVCR